MDLLPGAGSLPFSRASCSILPRDSWGAARLGRCPHLHLRLDPGPHNVGLAGKLAAEVLIGLLFALLLQEGVVPLGHQLLHLGRHAGRGSQGAALRLAALPRPASGWVAG